MITEDELAKQELELGENVVFHQGVWWKRHYPFYFKPLFELKEIVPGTACPPRMQSILGFSHAVPEKAYGNRSITYMVMKQEVLQDFSIEKINPKRRNRIRRGLKNVEIRRIVDIEKYMDDLHEINISQAVRTKEKTGFGLTPDYYTHHFEEWKQYNLKLFSLPKRHSYGAFVENKLIAYSLSIQINDTMMLQIGKCHSDYTKTRATDALLFKDIEHARETPGCSRIINGASSIPGLDERKEDFLFEKTPVWIYTKNQSLYDLLRKLAGRLSSLTAKPVKQKAAD